MIYQRTIRVLYIDMSTKKIRIVEREDLNRYMGGVGIASKLLEENMHTDLSPLDPSQPIVLAIGPLSTIYPVITKTVAMFISPLTGELGESYAGGRLALSMFSAGFDAIVINNKAEKPCYISISNNDVILRDARPMWGTEKDNIGRIIRFEEQHGGKRSIIRIGPAGENQISYANVTVDRYRHFGRLGLGALFGAKKLKAINIAGDREMNIENFPQYFKMYRKIYEVCDKSDVMKKYHDIGTPVNVLPLNAAGGLPTRNMQQSTFEYADKISGEVFSEERQVRKLACAGCPVGCIHIGQFRREFDVTGHEYETINVGYDYELIFALGSNLGLNNPEHILELIEEVEIAGLDAMSAGVALGWATEALEKGIISEKHTLLPLKFGSYKEYLTAVRFIANMKNEFYKNLGKGVKHAAEIYGGKDYAMQIAGNEMPGYHTGYGSLVGAAVGARQSHLDNGGYSIDQEMKPLDIDNMVDRLLKEEVERCMLNSLVICLFARKVYDRQTIIDAFEAIGVQMTNEELDAVAKRTYATKLRIKKALGIDLTKIKLPKRFFETPAMQNLLKEDVAMEIIEKYKEKITGLDEFE
ncbi:MAG: aldehyde:ferredoxin oxidoreductase [Firmicutes bacterium]|nr:aldehyde:ferredoxin oxidoreductase [Bacillota bacterium]